MRLVNFIYLTSVAALAIARALTLDDVLDSISMVSIQGASLQQEFESLQTGTSLVSLLALHGNLNSLLSKIDEINDDLKAIPGPVSAEECTEVLDALYQIQPVIEGGLKSIADKKDIIDNIPSFGRAPALIKLTLLDLKRLKDSMQETLLAITPDHCINEAHALANHIDVAYDTCFAVYK